MATEEKIELECPLCRKMHTFRLLVNRSVVVYSADDLLGSIGSNTVRRFRRTFICPVKGESFEATLRMEETSDESIEDVDVM